MSELPRPISNLLMLLTAVLMLFVTMPNVAGMRVDASHAHDSGYHNMHVETLTNAAHGQDSHDSTQDSCHHDQSQPSAEQSDPVEGCCDSQTGDCSHCDCSCCAVVGPTVVHSATSRSVFRTELSITGLLLINDDCPHHMAVHSLLRPPIC